jgi:hypothetical protein
VSGIYPSAVLILLCTFIVVPAFQVKSFSASERHFKRTSLFGSVNLWAGNIFEMHVAEHFISMKPCLMNICLFIAPQYHRDRHGPAPSNVSSQEN